MSELRPFPEQRPLLGFGRILFRSVLSIAVAGSLLVWGLDAQQKEDQRAEEIQACFELSARSSRFVEHLNAFPEAIKDVSDQRGLLVLFEDHIDAVAAWRYDIETLTDSALRHEVERLSVRAKDLEAASKRLHGVLRQRHRDSVRSTLQRVEHVEQSLANELTQVSEACARWASR